MNADKPSQILLDMMYASEHRLLEDRLGRSIARVVNTGVADKDIRQFLRERVHKHRMAQMFAGPFSIPQLRRGDILLGADQKGGPVRMDVQNLCAHSLTVGGSGSGKTTKSRWLILQVAPRVRGLWLFDFRKKEFACLVPLFARMGLDAFVVPARLLRLNPLQLPEGVDPYAWSSRAADLIVQVFRLPPRATKLLQLTTIDLFERFGVLRGGRKFPTLFDLREAIASNRNANPQARQAVVDALDPVLVSLRDVLAYRLGWSASDLANYRIVFELDSVGEVEKDLILSTLVMSEFTSRIARGVFNSAMDLWICADEAARLVSASSHGQGLSDLIGLVRGTGIGMDLAIQNVDVAPAILSNTAFKCIGRCGSAADYRVIADAMGLNADQKRYLAQTLVPGMFVGQLGEGDWRYPFLFRVPPVKPDHATTPQRPATSIHQLPWCRTTNGGPTNV